jgi:ketosteroid isomerase-like protein
MTGVYSSLRFENRVVSGLLSEVLREFQAEGAETGGILLGRRSGEEILIEDFEPALCEHRFGPSFVLSDDDLLSLQESLEWFRNSETSGLEVLGLYRSRTSGEQAEDLQLMQRFFAGQDALLVLLEPDGRKSATADVLSFKGSALEPLAGPIPLEEQPMAEPIRFPVLSEPLPALDPPPPVVPDETPSSPDQRRLLVPPDPAEIAAAEAAAAAEPEAPPEEPYSPGAGPGQETRPAEQRILFVPAAHPQRLDSEEPRRRNLWWIAAVGVLTVIGAILGYRSAGVKSGPEPSKPHPAAPAVPAVSTLPMPAAVSIPTPATARTSTPATDTLEEEIRAAVGAWISALRSGSPDRVASCYAPQVEQYFRERNASVSDVRQTVAQSVSRFGKPAILRISEMRVFPAGQDRAVASFRKHWQTAGPKVFAGEEHERLTFVRVRNAWKIASERETRVYWTQRPR